MDRNDLLFSPPRRCAPIATPKVVKDDFILQIMIVHSAAAHCTWWEVADAIARSGYIPEAVRGMATIRPELPAERLTPKGLYREARCTLGRDTLQSSWGRIQQQEEMEYEEFVLRALRYYRAAVHYPRMLPPPPEHVLESFDGFVEQIDGDVAYLTLKASNGEILHGEYPASELQTLGIRERRRFTCRTVDTGTAIRVDLSPVPDQQLTQEMERAIVEKVRQAIGGSPHDDY